MSVADSYILFYGFNDFFCEFWMSLRRNLVFRDGCQGSFCGESIIGDNGSGGVFNTTIVDRIFIIASGDVWISVGVAVIIFVVFKRNLVRNLILWIIFCWFGSCSFSD